LQNFTQKDWTEMKIFKKKFYGGLLFFKYPVRQTLVVYPPTGSTAYVREMSTLPTLLLEYGPPLPFI